MNGLPGTLTPTVVDRMIQQAIAQELTPIYEEQFSDNSYGFRPGRSAHDALAKCGEYVNEGYVYAISMDLQSYFDTVNHSKLIEVLSRTIKDGRVISLIHKYLKAGVMEDGGFRATSEGVPQGGPLSPLCGNVMLNELDKELERRGHKFVRYADDCMILCKSRKSAERTLKHIIPFITRKLYLEVNLEKTTVRGNKWSNPEREEKLRRYTTEWINYYRYADMKSLMETTDEWLRHRIRAVYWKQWKKVRTRYKIFRALQLPEWKVHELSNLPYPIDKSESLTYNILNRTAGR